MSKKFPKGFLWGASTSSHQIEGKNYNSDWWQWEQKGKTEEESGQACNYWDLWLEDHEFLSKLKVDSFRLSLEWAHIEPEEGKFSQEAIQHYWELLSDLKKRNIKTIVTFWHWVSPLWFQENYGFHNKKSVYFFKRYAEKIIEELGDLIDVVVTFNEPMVPLGMGYLTGKFPPGIKNFWKFRKALNNLAISHREIYKLVHNRKNIPVGITYLYNCYHTLGGAKFLEKIADKISRYYRIKLLGNKLKGYEDYFGVDYYRLGKIVYDRKNSEYLGFRIEEDKENAMGWITYPQGIYEALKEAYKYKKLPIYILENGIPTNLGIEDEGRIKFIKEHLEFVLKAINEGIDVRGYFHWSLMDNFEWLDGFRPRFGLIEVDYETLERKPRKSFWEYKKIIENNGLE